MVRCYFVVLVNNNNDYLHRVKLSIMCGLRS
jgi:hypothetical protein